MRPLLNVALSAITVACTRSHATPPTPDVAPTVLSADAGRTADAVVNAPRPTLAPRPIRHAGAENWRHLPIVALDGARALGRWVDAPDFDGDEAPDPILAIAYDPNRIGCEARDVDHPCPVADADDGGGDDHNGPLRIGFVVMFSGEAAVSGDAGTDDASVPTHGRLIGTRRVWQSALSLPTTSLRGFEFAEFGPGVLVRTILDIDDGARATDVLDVVNLFAGQSLDAHAGTIVHHCAHEAGHAPVRSGSIAVTTPSLTPLLWRAASAHPFSGCATDALAYDTALGAMLLAGTQVTVTSNAPAPPFHRLVLTVEGDGVRAVTRSEREQSRSDAGAWDDPLVAGDLTVLDMERACLGDRLRYQRGTQRCHLSIPRDDAPLPACSEHPSPLDPAPPRPIVVLPRSAVTDDGGAPTTQRLVFSRGGSLLVMDLPATCRHSDRHARAEVFTETLPPGLAASPDGRRVLFPDGDDLWLTMRGRPTPMLLNPRGGSLPRSTVRAAVFIDDTHAAAVFGATILRFDVVLPDVADEIPDAARIDPSEIRRGLPGVL